MKKWIFFPVLLFLFSCSNDNSFLTSRPKGVLNKEGMTEMMVDLSLAESALRSGNIQRTLLADSMYQKSQVIEVFRKHGVNPDDFNRSLTYYTAHIDQLNEIYTEVIARLSQMESELQKTSEKATSDSSSRKPVSQPVKVAEPAKK